MKEFKNGDEVLIDTGNPDMDSGVYIGPFPTLKDEHVVIAGGRLCRVYGQHIKLKPATISVNGIEVAKPYFDTSMSCDGQFSLSLDFGTNQKAMQEFSKALNLGGDGAK